VAARLLVVDVDADVADLRHGQAHQLAGVRGVGDDLLVAGHRRVEHDLADRGRAGAEAEAARLSAPYLGDLPLDGALRRAGDTGRPLVAADPQHPASDRFHQIAAQIAVTLGL
jgi:hypothetical protein